MNDRYPHLHAQQPGTGSAFFRVLAVCAVLCSLVLLLAPSPVFASFEDTSSGARSRGLAGAFAAVADDSDTLFSQPAGLALLQRPHLSVTYGKLLAGLSDGSNIADGMFSLALPLSETAGAGVAYKNIALENTYAETSVVLGGAWRPFTMLALGASAKYLSLSYGSDAYTALDPVFGNGYTRSGISADAGILFMPLPRLTFGYSRMNILSADMGLRENAAVPAIERAGVSYAEETALSTLEATRIEGQLRFAAGIEKYFAQKLVCLRLGFGWGDREYRKVTAGLGLAVQQLSIGYAWDYPLSGIRDVSGTHYVTIGFSFGGEQAGARHSVAEQPVRPTLPQEITASPVPVSADAESSREDVVLSTPAPIVPVVSESSAAVPSVTAKKEPRQVERKAAAKTHITHTVAGGETLPALAEKYYGARASWTRIYEANKDKVEKGSLKPGDVLIIP